MNNCNYEREKLNKAQIEALKRNMFYWSTYNREHSNDKELEI